MQPLTPLRGVAAVAALALPLAACGSSSPGSSSSSSRNAKASSQIAFANCVRSHGVPNFPDPGSNGRGGLLLQQSDRSGSGQSMTVNGAPVSAPAFKAAMQTCRKYLPNGGHPSAAQTAQQKAKALAMARCMRSHGVPNFPDPTFQSGPGGDVGVRIGGPGLDPNSPAFKSAQQACGPIFGKAPGAGAAAAPAP
jgi:hypothetical protein